MAVAVGGRGLAGVHQRSEEIQSQRQSFGLRKFTPEFRWDGSKPPAENQLNLRILGDDIMISTQMHRGVPLPENKFFFGVCRHAFPIQDNFCYVCDVLGKSFEGDAKARKRNGITPTDVAVALAVEQEPVLNGRVQVGWRNKMVDFEIPQVTDAEKSGDATAEEREYRKLLDKLGLPGVKVQVPNIGMMVGTMAGAQGLFDFVTRRPTISDRVYEISRHGNKLETKWDWNHDGADKENPDPTEMLAEFAAKYPFELPEEWAHRTGATERYNYFFKLTPDAKGDGETAASSSDDVEPVSDSRAQLMERLRGKGSSS